MHWPNLLVQVAVALATMGGVSDDHNSSPKYGAALSKQVMASRDIPGGPHLLKEVPASPFPSHIPGEGTPSWSSDGRYLVFATPSGLAVLQFNSAITFHKVNDLPSFDPAWNPSGSQIAFVSERQDGHRTIFVQPPHLAKPVDALPGDMAVRGIKDLGLIHRWLDYRTIAYDGNAGSGLKWLFVVDIDAQQHRPTPRLTATSFIWSQDGNLVAGQMGGTRRSFWIWSRKPNTIAGPSDTYPGEHQVFETFFDQGQKALFSSWNGRSPYAGVTPAGLHELNIASGMVREVAASAALASSSDSSVAYVRFGQRLTLVVQDSVSRRVYWSDDLGEVTPASKELPNRPQFFGAFVVYQTLGGEWRISHGTEKDVRTIYRGRDATLSVSPDGRYIAVLDNVPEPRLLVYQNPLLPPQPGIKGRPIGRP